MENNFVRLFEPQPEVVIDHTLTIVLAILGTIFGIIILGIIGWLVYNYLKKKKEQDLHQPTPTETLPTEQPLNTLEQLPETHRPI